MPDEACSLRPLLFPVLQPLRHARPRRRRRPDHVRNAVAIPSDRGDFRSRELGSARGARSCSCCMARGRLPAGRWTHSGSRHAGRQPHRGRPAIGDTACCAAPRTGQGLPSRRPWLTVPPVAAADLVTFPGAGPCPRRPGWRDPRRATAGEGRVVAARETCMSVVLVEPSSFAVDWDWQRGLTVWTVQGPRFDRPILEYQLATRPGNESRARRAVRRWWRAQGHDRALSRARASAAGSGRQA